MTNEEWDKLAKDKMFAITKVFEDVTDMEVVVTITLMAGAVIAASNGLPIEEFLGRSKEIAEHMYEQERRTPYETH